MQKKQPVAAGLLGIAALLILILDSKTALTGAKEGIELVLNTVIPSLLPFMLATTTINNLLIGRPMRCLNGLNKLCGLPAGAEPIFLLGMIGGYPLGAKMIYDAYQAKQINETTAKRMLGFCSNAGLAFIFGMVSQLFAHKYIVVIIWLIHVFSAILVGILLPNKTRSACLSTNAPPQSFSKTIEQCAKTMVLIAIWILIWRIVICFLNRYIFSGVNDEQTVILIGLCELANGSIALHGVANESIRFVLATCFLSWGGLCVAMQTRSIVKSLGTGHYFLGKFLQTLVTLVLATLFGHLLYPAQIPGYFNWASLSALLLILLFIFLLRKRKIMVAFQRKVLYNG